MSVSSFGSAVSGGLPAGAKELLIETFAPTGKYTYTPASPLPAGNYILKTSSCETTYATIGNKTYTSQNNQINIKLDAPATSVEFNADQSINLDARIDIETPVPLILNPVTNVLSLSSAVQYYGESNGIHYGARAGFLVKSLDRVHWVKVYEIAVDAVDFTSNAGRTKVFTINGSTVITFTNKVMITADGGVTWLTRNHNLSATVTAYGANVWVMVNTSNVAYSSTDLITWTNRGTLAGALFSLIYEGSQFIGASYGRVYTNASGTGTWVLQTSAAGISTSACVNNLAYSGSLYMLINDNGSCYTSPTGSTWTLKTTFTNTPRGLIWFNNTFAAIATGVNKAIKTSTDGTTWTTLTLNAYVAGQTATMSFVYWQLNAAKTELFVHGDAPNTYVYYGITTNLIDWRMWDGRNGTRLGFSGKMFGKINNDLYFGNQTDIYKTSDYGKTWTAWNVYSTTINEFTGWTYAAGKFFGFGRIAALTYNVPIISTDGITWTHVATQVGGYVQDGWGEGDYYYALTQPAGYAVRLKNDGTFVQTSTGSTTMQPINSVGEIQYLRVLANVYCINYGNPVPTLEQVFIDLGVSTLPGAAASSCRVFPIGRNLLYVTYDPSVANSFSVYLGDTYNRFATGNTMSPPTGTKGVIPGTNNTAYFYGDYQSSNYTMLKVNRATTINDPQYKYMNGSSTGQGAVNTSFAKAYWMNTNGQQNNNYFNGMPPARTYSGRGQSGVTFLMLSPETTFSLYSAV